MVPEIGTLTRCLPDGRATNKRFTSKRGECIRVATQRGKRMGVAYAVQPCSGYNAFIPIRMTAIRATKEFTS